ncbi:MAG: hypothetical protein PHD37_05320 [Gallionellaceae bacterium]|nr:hypothetical protein [Gallionellaceae bacterium]
MPLTTCVDWFSANGIGRFQKAVHPEFAEDEIFLIARFFNLIDGAVILGF